ncbi:MAG: squalene/phytoene synthase family protein [Acidobacteria bacterium]|nr:squalene/phytoene synthase family protein [Acidobacteriota bacterium]
MGLPESTIEKAYRYCEEVTRLHAKSFYFAAGFLPAAKRRAVFPIYAFCRHVDDEIDELGLRDEAAAIRAVERWQANLQMVYDGKIDEERPANDEQTEVLTAWRDLLENYRIPPDLPRELVEGVLMDTRIKRYETFDELYVYCYRVASTVGLMSSEILGYREPKALAYAEAMGIGMQLTNILRDVGEDAEKGRIYLPQEDLRRFGVTTEQIFERRFDRNFEELVKFELERARSYYREGEKGIALLEKDSRFTVLLAARVYAKILDEIEKQHYNVFIRRAHTSRTQKLLAVPGIWLEARKL